MHRKLAITLIVGTLSQILSGMVFAQTEMVFAQTGMVAVVVNEKNPITNLSGVELRNLFGGQKRNWGKGVPVRLFVRAPEAHERTVLLHLLNMSESEYKTYWRTQVFRGEAQSEPVVLFSNGMQKEAVAAYPGAVALVNIEDVKTGMKVLKIDGHFPGESGYPLR